MKKLGIIGPVGAGNITVEFLELENTSKGMYRSLVQFAPVGNTDLTTTTEVKLQTSAETSKKGLVRVMLKVSMPYSALYPSDTASGASNLKFSAARSRGEVSAHIVLTLPKECVEDIVQQKAGSVGRTSALSHIFAVMNLLQQIPLTNNGASYAARIALPGMGVVDSRSPESTKPLADNSSAFVAPLSKLEDFEDTEITPAQTTVTLSNGVLRVADAESDGQAFIGLLDRVMRGYEPLGDQDNVGLNSALEIKEFV